MKTKLTHIRSKSTS